MSRRLVSDTPTHYTIHYSPSAIYMQRKFTTDVSGNPLALEEVVIRKLCARMVKLEAEIEAQEKVVAMLVEHAEKQETLQNGN